MRENEKRQQCIAALLQLHSFIWSLTSLLQLVQSTTLAFMLDLLLLTHKRCWNFQFLTKKIALCIFPSEINLVCLILCIAKLSWSVTKDCFDRQVFLLKKDQVQSLYQKALHNTYSWKKPTKQYYVRKIPEVGSNPVDVWTLLFTKIPMVKLLFGWDMSVVLKDS